MTTGEGAEYKRGTIEGVSGSAVSAEIGEVAVGAAAGESELPKTEARPEIAWYVAQSARDLRDLNAATLRINMLNLESAQSRGELEPLQHHELGWVQLDYARTITDRAQDKRVEARVARAQETRVSRFDAPRFVAAAVEADMLADELIVEAKGRFDIARSTFLAAAESVPREQAGEPFEMLLHAEATSVYKALFTEPDQSTLEETVDTYVRNLAGLYTPMRKAEARIKQNVDQSIALEVASLKTALCLLISGSSEEAARDLALPASLRCGGVKGEMDIVIFPIDYSNNRYDTETPVNVQLTQGGDIAHERCYVAVGWDLLMQRDDRLGLLTKLFRASKPSGKKRRERGEAIDNLALRITDAIADATEYRS